MRFLYVVVLLAMPQFGFSQVIVPRVEIFAGGSYLPAGGDDFPRQDSGGFQAGVNVNISRWFGVAADFGGHYSDALRLRPDLTADPGTTSVYEYMAGPRLTMRREKISLFVHWLLGGARGRTTTGFFSDSEFAVAAGGGLDFHLNDRLAIRAVQLDWIGSFTDMVEGNNRIGAGIVVKLGRFSR